MLPTPAQEIPKEIRERAKLMFLSHYSIDEIVAANNIPREAVEHWVFGADGHGTAKNCWNVARASLSEASIATFLIDKQHVFERSTGLALSCLTKGLSRLNERVHNGELDLEVDDLRKLSAVVTEMDKIGRLETGKATQIIKNVGLTPEKIREIIKNDPIVDEVVVEYTTLDDL